METKHLAKPEQTKLISIKGLLGRLVEFLKTESFLSWMGLSFRSKNRIYFK